MFKENYDDDFGIFAGTPGLDQHYEVKTLPMRADGVPYVVTCDTCGCRQEITLEWAQLADAARAPQTSKLPVDPVTRMEWGYDRNTMRMYPRFGCNQCRREVGFSITPDEAGRLLRDGQMAGLVVLRR
jgi:hypothetical protein